MGCTGMYRSTGGLRHHAVLENLAMVRDCYLVRDLLRPCCVSGGVDQSAQIVLRRVMPRHSQCSIVRMQMQLLIMANLMERVHGRDFPVLSVV